MDIPECGNNTTGIYKKQEEMRKIGEMHKTEGDKCTKLTNDVIEKTVKP